MAVARRATPPMAEELANFGDLSFYGGNLGLPEGNWAMEFGTQLFQPTKRDGSIVGSPFLAVMMKATPITPDGERAEGDVQEHPLSMGQKAKEGWMPSASGKGMVRIPGTTVTLPDTTNWVNYLNSLKQCGLPEGIFTNDLSVLDGVWVHTQNINEPESRKQNQANTGEAGDLQPQRVRKMVVVTEILEGGKPWEGTGGIPDETPAKAAPKAVAKSKVKAAPAPEPEAAAEGGDEELESIAQSGMASMLGQTQYANGCSRLALRTGTFNAVKKSHGDDYAQATLADYFEKGDGPLNTILEPLGYVCKGGMIKVR